MAIPNTSTPTIQEILQSYQQGVGAGGVNTALLIQALKERQRRAVEEDTRKAKGLQSAGKVGLNLYKARRDYLLAKRGNPDLKFRDFMADPKTSAKYMEKGSASIASGESPAIGIKEILNPFSKNYARNLSVEKTQSSPEYIEARKNVNRSIPSAQTELSDYQISDKPLDVEDFSNLPKPAPYAPPQPMGPVTNEGLKQAINAGQPSFTGLSRGAGVNIPSAPYLPVDQIANYTKANPQMIDMGAGVIGKAPVSSQTLDIRRPAMDMGFQNINKVAVSDPTVGASATQASGGLGTAGKALGKASNIYGVGKGLQEISEGGGDLSTVAGTAGSLAALTGFHPLVAGGLGLLSYLSRR